MLWNQVELKVKLAELGKFFDIRADMEVDSGNSFSYTIIVQFPSIFHSQMIKSMFANYDAVPQLINPGQLAIKNLRSSLERNAQKYGKTAGSNTLLEVLEIKRQSQKMKIEYINSIESALFGEFNNAQLENFPKVRLKQSYWVPYCCFKPVISKEQMYQAAILASDKNPLDQVSACLMEILNVNDVQNVNLTLESLSQVHTDKLQYGKVKADFLLNDHNNTDNFFSEDQRAFISLFMSCLKTKQEYNMGLSDQDKQDISKQSLYNTPQHLLFAYYLLVCLKARESKTKLLYSLNAFRAIQKRVTLELRELGSRDRVMGDCQIKRPCEKTQHSEAQEIGEMGESSKQNAPQAETISIENPALVELVDLYKYRFNGDFYNQVHSTCPIVPKYHATFGDPVDRQEVSAEFEVQNKSDPKKGYSQKLLGRVDKIEEHTESGYMMVTDDYGVNVLYDATFADMRNLEQEMLRTCSYYINKVEPVQDTDLRNILPTVDRFSMIENLLEFEEKFHKAKLDLSMTYLECLEHTCDPLDQQRIIQMINDLMAKRPRLNLAANFFKDSYSAEIE